MEALLACSAIELQSESALHRQLAESYYANAVLDLRAYLTKNDTESAEVIALQAAMLLCIFERSRLHHSDIVNVHLCGAAVLVKSCYQRRKMPRTRPDPRAATLHIAFEGFIFQTSTSVVFQNEVPQSSDLDEAFATALQVLALEREAEGQRYHSPVLGAPPRVFAFVRQVSLLYRQLGTPDFNLHECHALEDELVRWTRENFPQPSLHDYTRQHSVEGDSPLDVDEGSRGLCLSSERREDELLILGPKLYLLSSRILIRHMTAPRTPEDDPVFAALISEAMALIHCIQPELDYFGDFYTWPFFCLGISPLGSEDREFLMNLVMTFWTNTRSGTMKRLADMLNEGWKRSEGCDWYRFRFR